jgi:phage tail protein X
MTDYLPYLTREGDRWDLIAYRLYGDVGRQDLIIAANPELAITPMLPAGVTLRVPILPDDTPPPETLPPWKT